MRVNILTLFPIFMIFLMPVSAFSIDKLVVEDDVGTEIFVVTDEGKVGIGTATPAAALDAGGGEITVNGADTSGQRPPGLSAAGTGRMNIGYGGSGGANLEMYSKGHASRAGELRFVYGGGGYGNVRYIHYNGTGWKTNMIILEDGKVGIGTQTPSYTLQMGGGAYSDGFDWYPASSREYKENIVELKKEEAFHALNKLNPVKFNYRADTSELHIGFIAEDVPDLVATNERKGLSPMDIVAVLTRVVKEQQKTISELREQNEEISNKIMQFERALKLSNSLAFTEVK